MKFEMILNAYTNAVIDEQVLLFVGNAQEERKMRATADKTIGRSYLRNRQAAAFRARLLSMYSLDTLRRAELEAENRQLRQQLEEMENTEIAQENFFDAVRTDTEMTQEQKDYWLAMEPTERENAAEGGRDG